MSTTPREIGTLIVVILKARNLPNKRHIGKQDPYCTVILNGEKRRTKAIKRGGQHPEWDEEIRFHLLEGVGEELTESINGDGTPPPPPPKNSKAPPTIKGGKFMSVACYAEDAREPDLIGEAQVDLTEVLTKGETDEWFTLMSKEKYCGEVYLELTFWSNEPPPVKKVTPKARNNQSYGGPGSFVPSGSNSSVYEEDGRVRVSSTSSMNNDIPASLRPSNSLAKIDLYVPPYETSRSHMSSQSMDRLANDFSELGVLSPAGRRQSFPPHHGGFVPRPTSSAGVSDSHPLLSYPSHGSYHGNYSEEGNSYYNDAVTPTVGGHSYRHSSISYQEQYQQQQQHQYDAPPQSSLPYQNPPHQRPRYSVPTSSSGFVPVPTPAPSGFVPIPSSLPPQPTGFPSHPTPAPLGYGPPPAHTPGPSSSFSSIPHAVTPSSSFSTLPQPPAVSGFALQPSQSGHYHQPPPPANYSQLSQYPPSHSAGPQPQQYPPSQTISTPQQYTHPQPGEQYYASHQPPQQYASPPPISVPTANYAMVPQQYQQSPQSGAPYSHSAPPDHYAGHTPPTPPHELIPPPPPLNGSPSPAPPAGSRPLPQQPQSPAVGQPIRQRRHSYLPMPPQAGAPQSALYSSQSVGNTAAPYTSIPPPPPLPQSRPNPPPLPNAPNHHSQLPAPPATTSSSQYPSAPVKRPSLPAPPVGYPTQQKPAYQPLALPPPPALPHGHIQEQFPSFPSPNLSQTYNPGPPPRPPVMHTSQSFTSGSGQPMYGNHNSPPIADGSWS